MGSVVSVPPTAVGGAFTVGLARGPGRALLSAAVLDGRRPRRAGRRSAGCAVPPAVADVILIRAACCGYSGCGPLATIERPTMAEIYRTFVDAAGAAVWSKRRLWCS